MTKRLFTILAVLVAVFTPIQAFVQPSQRRISTKIPNQVSKHSKLPHKVAFPHRTNSVACFGFNLPPGRNNDDSLQEILVGAASVVGLILFFASPLGGLFFAAVNSVFALLLITPVVLILVFNIWQFVNTTTGECPNCSAPVRVLKDGSPSICFSCGSIIEATSDGRIDFAPNVQQFESQQDDSLFGSMFDGNDGAFGGRGQPQQRVDERKEQYRRERTVIDVDVEED